jgi:HTH-type transcriptional repressor of NAD biosynthesis genes
MRIAREQNRREDEASSHAPVVIADTDSFATGIWHERYLGHRAADVEALAPPAARRLYLLTHHDDVPFSQDGVRDGEHLRAWMTETFAQRLAGGERAWRWLRGGSFDARLTRALELIAELEAAAWRFAQPLG